MVLFNVFTDIDWDIYQPNLILIKSPCGYLGEAQLKYFQVPLFPD